MAVKHIDTGTTAGVGGVLFTDRRQFYIQPNTYAELWTAITPFLSSVMMRGETRTGLADPLFKMSM